MTQKKRLTVEQIRKLKRPNRHTVEVVLDNSVQQKIEALERRYLTEARIDNRENRPPQAPAIALEIEKLRDEAQDQVVEFVFEDIGRASFEALVEAYPPEQKHIDRYGDDLQWNPETFAPALIAATCVDPEGMTLEDAQAICDEWSNGDVQRLFTAALTVCMETVSIPFTRSAIGEIANSALSSTIASNEESPTPTT